MHVAKDSEEGVTARYEVVVRHGEAEHLLAVFEDDAPGDKGRAPFTAETPAPDEPPPACGVLTARFTNMTGGTLGIVVVPPDYLSWIDLEVASPGDLAEGGR